jgi:hypothetical protein
MVARTKERELDGDVAFHGRWIMTGFDSVDKHNVILLGCMYVGVSF